MQIVAGFYVPGPVLAGPGRPTSLLPDFLDLGMNEVLTVACWNYLVAAAQFIVDAELVAMEQEELEKYRSDMDYKRSWIERICLTRGRA
jgi:hypothetical protein